MPSQKRFLFLSILICAVYFIAFGFPNHAGSENLSMISLVQPDEAVPLSNAINMIRPAETIKQVLVNFAFYSYYFYGYPHFAFSALVLLPLKWTNGLENLPLVMLALRQLVSVLPMVLANLILVYMLTKFRTYKAILLLMFLLTLPAVVENNLWWHPDSLAILFVILTLYFISRDEHRLGGNFYISAIMCGFATGTKGLGWYFFLAIGVYLALSLLKRKASLKRVFISGILFILVMLAAYVFSNPLLVYASIRQKYIEVMEKQLFFLQKGYEVIYDIGPIAATPSVRIFYGSWITVLIALGANLWSAVRGPNRLLHQMIFAWFIPLTILIFAFIHFKYQYWMPVMLPLFSTLVVLLPDSVSEINFCLDDGYRNRLARVFRLLILAGLGVQLAFNLVSDIRIYNNKLHIEEREQAIGFYTRIIDVLEPLVEGDYYVYHDVRMYLPSTGGWVQDASFEMLDYAYIEERDFDVLLLLQQRIYDYTSPEIQGVDPVQLTASQEFYHDANAGKLSGYRLVYRDEFGLIFVSDSLFQSDFSGH